MLYAALLVLLALNLDCLYFFNFYLVRLWTKLFQPPASLDQTGCYYGLCTPNDLDVYLTHMNNARYLRAMDFARTLFFSRNRLIDYLLQLNSHIVVNSFHIRYRRPIYVFSPYKILSKIVFWERRAIYARHQFVGAFNEELCTEILCKYTVVGCDVRQMMADLGAERAPERPPVDIADWVNFNVKENERFYGNSARILSEIAQ